MTSQSPLPVPTRITASNLSLPASTDDRPSHEPGVEVQVDQLPPQVVIPGYYRAVISTLARVPTSNDGVSPLPLPPVPGAGIVHPTGVNIYYLDIAPGTIGAVHRTTSTDYVVVLKGTLDLDTPSAGAEGYNLGAEGKESLAREREVVRTSVKEGGVVVQRGMMHALSNRTDQWVRVMCFVVASEANKVQVRVEATGEDRIKFLEDKWLA